ncbi:MAG: PaaI family thioesterase, partial [Myxococcota bacterium]
MGLGARRIGREAIGVGESESEGGRRFGPGRVRGDRETIAARRSEPLRFEAMPEWQRLARAIRRQVAASVELDVDPSILGGLADRAEALAAELEAGATGKRVGLVEAEWHETGAMHYLPFSPIMGGLNPASIGVEIHPEPSIDGVACEVVLGEVVEGGTGLVHGGMIAAIYDEVLAAANLVRRVGGPTGRLIVHYRKPTPLHEPLRFEAWVDRLEGRKILTRGRCLAGGELVTEAEG